MTLTRITNSTLLSSKSKRDRGALSAQRIFYSIQAIVIRVSHPEDSNNIPSKYKDMRATCDVFVVDGGPLIAHGMVIPNVAIACSSPMGAPGFNYEEILPKGISDSTIALKLINDIPFDTDINPSTLDGDYVIVNFLAGDFSKPYVDKYWPHPSNEVDAMRRVASTPSQRRFARINKTEITIPDDGSVEIDTRNAIDGSIDIDVKKEKAVTVRFGNTILFKIRDTGKDVLVTMGASPVFSAIVGEVMQEIYDNHTHPTAVGPSGPPMSVSSVPMYFEPPVPGTTPPFPVPFTVPVVPGSEKDGIKPKDIICLPTNAGPGLMSLNTGVLSNKVKIPGN